MVKKYILIIALSVIIFPILSHAQEDSSSTDFSTPYFHMSMDDVETLTTDFSTYTTPATVNYSGATGVNNLFLYLANGSSPVCSINYGSTSGAINSNCSGGGSFDGTIAGDYQFLETFAANCFSSSYSACLAANGASYSEVDFSITSGGGGGGDSTSTAMSTSADTDQSLGIVYMYIAAILSGVIVLGSAYVTAVGVRKIAGRKK